MPEKKTMERARRDRRQGKAATTQAGEYVREEFEHVRHGKHGARSPKQAIAIGLSKARRAGVKVKPPRRGQASAATRHKAEHDLARGRHHGSHRPSARRSRAVSGALKREGRSSASHAAISRQSRSAAHRRHAGHGSARSHASGRTGSSRRTSTRRSRRATAAR